MSPFRINNTRLLMNMNHKLRQTKNVLVAQQPLYLRNYRATSTSTSSPHSGSLLCLELNVRSFVRSFVLTKSWTFPNFQLEKKH